MTRHISRWDLDKTYLRTEFDTVRDLVRTAFERADEKRTNPGAATLLREMARAGGGELLSARSDPFQDHPAGGCRMGSDPATSVTDAWGRTHDHENLYVAGAPTCVSGGCANATLTFCALSLRTAAEIGKDFPAHR